MFRTLLFCAAFIGGTLTAQDTIQVMFYNLLNFPSSGAVNRQDTMARIFSHVPPDLLLVCELESAAGADAVLNSLNGLGIGPYQRAAYVSNQSGTNNLQNMCYWRSDKLSLLSQDEIITDLRDINEYRMLQVDATTGDSIIFDAYATHLKAGTGSTNEDRRALAIDALTAHLVAQPGAPYKLFSGDLNLYRSSEPSYQALLNDGPAFFEDPISRPGSWSNSSSYQDIHTQSTRTTTFGTGASGGLDDRFDHIMLGGTIMADTGDVRYLSSSYDAVGNDANHFNQAINDGFNSAVPASVANALHQSSDHLPVVLKLILSSTPDTTTVPPPTGGGCGGLLFSEYIEGTSNNKAIELYNAGSDPIDLSGYSVSVFNNGSTTANSTATLSGTLAAGATYQIVNSSADAALLGLADITSGVTFYNGDDALGLFEGGTLIDAIGLIGSDPGSSWTVGSGATAEYTLVRDPSIIEGQPDWSIGAGTWLVYPQNTFGFYGSHSADPCEADSCLASSIPAGLASTIGGSGVTLTWNDLPGAVKCEVNGRPLGAGSFAKIRGDVPPYTSFVPAGALTPGTTYEWKLRCACSLSPLVVTGFSTLESFVWPTARISAAPQQARFSPNPASTTVLMTWPSAEGSTPWLLRDLLGQTRASGIRPAGMESVRLDVHSLPAGLYFLENEQGIMLGKMAVSP